MLYPKRFLFDADTGNGGQGGETDNAAGAATPESGQTTYTAEQQAHIDKLIGERLSKAKSQWQADLEAQKTKAEKDAEAKRLEEEKQYQKLLDLERGKVAELEPLQGQLEKVNETIEAYRQTVSELLTAKVEALGDTAKTAVDNLPGEPDALAKLKWLNANEALFKQSNDKPNGGTPPRRSPFKPLPNVSQPAAPAQGEPPLIRI